MNKCFTRVTAQFPTLVRTPTHWEPAGGVIYEERTGALRPISVRCGTMDYSGRKILCERCEYRQMNIDISSLSL